MSHQPVDIATVDTPASRFDTVIEWLMVALLAFMPLALGAVEAWSELVVVALAAAMTACLALKRIICRDARLVWTWAYVPVGLLLLTAALQLVPMPAGVIGAISPQTAATRTDLLGDLPNADGALKSMTLSFYPCATRHDLRIMLAVAAVFFVAVNVYRRSEQIKRLLAAIAVIGAAIAALAVAQIISGTDRIYWAIPTGSRAADAGTFVNHSNFAQFMNLSIGAALGLLIVNLREGFGGSHVTLPGVVEQLTGLKARTFWLLTGAVVVGAAAVFLSLSRGGAVALLIAASFTAVIIASRRALGGRGWIMALMALAAFVCVLYVGFDAVYDRLSTLRQDRQYESRWQIVSDIAVGWTKFPVFGVGSGTHAVVYPMFERSTIPALAGHAENEYAQAAEEMGVIGLGLLVAFGAIVWRGYARCIRKARRPIRSAAYGLGFGLLAILIHSLSDFGQHLPANACLSAVFCGLLVGLAQNRGKEQANPTRLKSTGSGRVKAAGVVSLAVLVAVWGWALAGAGEARAAEAHWKHARRIEKDLRENAWLVSNEDYADLISRAAAAAERQPDNVEYRHWLNVYRWRSISRVRDKQTGSVVLPPRGLEFTRRIVDELNGARELCPTFGPTYCVIGQLEMSVLGRPEGADRIRKGYRLAPNDATACLVAGLLDAREGSMDAGMAKFRQAVALDGGLFGEIAEAYVHEINRADLAVEIAGDDVRQLFRVVRLLSEKGSDQQLADAARTKAIEILRAKCRESDAPAWALAMLAGICRIDKDYDSAIEFYRRALHIKYGQVYWRLALARALASAGQTDEAIREARVCLMLRPQMQAAKKLIEDLSLLARP